MNKLRHWYYLGLVNLENETSKELKSVSEKMLVLEGKSLGVGNFYTVWLRIAIMIVNLILVHKLLFG